MKHRHSASLIFGTAIAVAVAAEGYALEKFAPFDNELATQGKMLFERDWLKEGRLNGTGDGLGPMYNAVSCATCHHQKGVGGGGADEHNVELLSIARKNLSGAGNDGDRLIDKAQNNVHPGFNGATWLTLHKYGPEAPFTNLKLTDYSEFRDRIVGKKKTIQHGKEVAIPQLSRERPVRRIGGVLIHYSQRNTPALFGAGLIDSIPDAVLVKEAEQQSQQKTKTGIAGRVPRTAGGQVGRFGWRGDTATLHEFVLAACANELGLEVRGHRQSASPDDPQPAVPAFAQQEVDEKRFDLTDDQCRSMTAFVANLPAPGRAQNLAPEQAKMAAEGENVFASARCDVCHKPNLGQVEGLYSDLLLHDLGKRLSDPAPAASWSYGALTGRFNSNGKELYPGQKIYEEAFRRFVPEAFGDQGQFRGASFSLSYGRPHDGGTTNIEQEWRTPPLWGVADSAPYLHDGRAKTLEEAIRWHGGEAEFSVNYYNRLKPAQREQLLAFLKTLVAPDS